MGKLNDNRAAWVITAAFGAAALIGGLAAALGFQTPAAAAAKANERLDAHDVRLTDHETRIQRLEDHEEALRAIAAALGVEVPKKHEGSR